MGVIREESELAETRQEPSPVSSVIQERKKEK